jgi:hypothetical protein
VTDGNEMASLPSPASRTEAEADIALVWLYMTTAQALSASGASSPSRRPTSPSPRCSVTNVSPSAYYAWTGRADGPGLAILEGPISPIEIDSLRTFTKGPFGAKRRHRA